MNWHRSRRRLACLFCVVAFCVLFVWFLLLVLVLVCLRRLRDGLLDCVQVFTSSLLRPLNLQTAMCMR